MNYEDTNRIDIRIIYKTEEFEKFYAGLSESVKRKFEYVFNVVQTVYNLPQKFVKKLENTDFYEMRVSVGTNEYRSVLFSIDHENVIESTRIILLNGFLKKSRKDYKKEIDKAENILKELEL
jgi:phage-related protein